MIRFNKKQIAFLQQLLAGMQDRFHVSYRLVALSEFITRDNDELYEQTLGVGIKEMRILRLARMHPGQSVQVIGKWTFVEKAMMSRLVSRLCELGYLERRIDPDDARSTQLFVTKSGAALVKKADAMANQLAAEQLPTLSDEDCRSLTRVLDDILLNYVQAHAADADEEAEQPESPVVATPKAARKPRRS